VQFLFQLNRSIHTLAESLVTGIISELYKYVNITSGGELVTCRTPKKASAGSTVSTQNIKYALLMWKSVHTLNTGYATHALIVAFDGLFP